MVGAKSLIDEAATGATSADRNIIGATTMAQLEQNLASLDVALSDDVIADIEAVHTRQPNPSP